MLHGSETWPVRKENVVALQRAEMRMVRGACGVKLKDRLPSKELRERLSVSLPLPFPPFCPSSPFWHTQNVGILVFWKT